jgi:predicted nucleotidyltransferase
MMAWIETHREQIIDLCWRYGVARLDLFGSATTNRFAPAHSDLDFIVRLAYPDAPGSARRFVALAEAVEQLLGRPVDLLTDEPFANRYFAQAVAETSQTVYETRGLREVMLDRPEG